jgi:hypothetical protein
MKQASANSGLSKSARNELAKFGIVIAFTESGIIELTSRHGIKCGYSARGFSPVIGFGADGRSYVRLIGAGIAEFRIDGEEFRHRKNDPSLQIAVPK